MTRMLIPAALIVAATGVGLIRGLVGGPDCPACQVPGAALEQTSAAPAGLLLIAPPTNVDAPKTLKVGDAAPALSVDKWVQGDEVKSFAKGHAYVVEFWATWCPPCRKSIPHLDKLSKKFKDHLTVIGMASSERRGADKDKDDRSAKVQSFVKEHSATMGYTVAFDGDNTMNRDWMRPAGMNYIPAAFVISPEGKITWIGNPLDDAFEAEVTKVVDAAKGAAKKS